MEFHRIGLLLMVGRSLDDSTTLTALFRDAQDSAIPTIALFLGWLRHRWGV